MVVTSVVAVAGVEAVVALFINQGQVDLGSSNVRIREFWD